MRTSKRKPVILILLSFAALTAVPSLADEIYKIVDKDGKVTYSSELPQSTSDVDITGLDIDPDANVIKPESSQAAERLKQEYNQRYPNNNSGKDQQKVESYKQKLTAAKQAVNLAKKAITEGKTVAPGDFIGKSGGGVRPSLQRQSRLESLNKNLESAEENLRQVIKSRPF